MQFQLQGRAWTQRVAYQAIHTKRSDKQRFQATIGDMRKTGCFAASRVLPANSQKQED
jgi:hypothetical protein